MIYLKYFFATLLFIAIFDLPIEYFTLLRYATCAGAIWALTILHKNQKIWLLIFGLILVLFNPIFPVYLYQKSYWIPIDIAAAIAFLLLHQLQEKEFIEEQEDLSSEINPYTRDQIFKTKYQSRKNSD